jgi:putative membrane protein
MMHGWNGWMGWGSAWGVLWMLLLVGLTVAVAVALARWLLPRSGAGGDRRGGGDDALGVLRARYARGEIDEDEYRARRTILTEAHGGRL